MSQQKRQSDLLHTMAANVPPAHRLGHQEPRRSDWALVLMRLSESPLASLSGRLLSAR